MLNKKAIGNTQDIWNAVFISLIIGIVILLTLIPLIWSWFNAAKGIGDDEKCRAAVQIAAKTKLVQEELKDCKAVPIEIKYSKNENVVREQLAQTMKRCWDKFGANSKPPLDPFPNMPDFCVICSINTFDKSFSEDIYGFRLYLAEHNPAGMDETYYQYFTGKTMTEQEIEELKKDGAELSTKMKYATILYINKEINWQKFWKGLGIGSATAATGVIALSFTPLATGKLISAIAVTGSGAIGGVMAAGDLDIATASVLIAPYDYALLSMKCHDLGVEPFESYFS